MSLCIVLHVFVCVFACVRVYLCEYVLCVFVRQRERENDMHGALMGHCAMNVSRQGGLRWQPEIGLCLFVLCYMSLCVCVHVCVLVCVRVYSREYVLCVFVCWRENDMHGDIVQ